MNYYLAIDLGASNGRHIVGHLKDNHFELDEVYRFKTGMDKTNDGLCWNLDRLFYEIKKGIRIALKKYPSIISLSIDTWGVDYVLLNGDKPIPPFYSYRNERVNKTIDQVHNVIPFEKLYEKTGIQFVSFNSIYQLFDDLKKGRLESATDFLFLPQYFSFLLTGKKKTEYTSASTSGLINASNKQFDKEIIKELGLPVSLFKDVSLPGETLGYLKNEIANEVGGQIKVILGPGHDTACAFEAVETSNDSVFLSSGTWSCLGYRLASPNTSKESFKHNFTNEGGVSYIRYLKNIMGMWLQNEVQKEVNLSYQDMVRFASTSDYEETFDVNDESLTAPKSMIGAINKLLEKNPPKNNADLFKSIYLSLAESYSNTIKELEDCLKVKINQIYIVGGGSKNVFLNDLTRKASNKKVIALPIEATAIGNIKFQMKINHENI